MLRADIHHDQVHARLVQEEPRVLGFGEIIVGCMGAPVLGDLVDGSLDEIDVLPLGDELGCLLPVLVEAERGGVIHDRPEDPSPHLEEVVVKARLAVVQVSVDPQLVEGPSGAKKSAHVIGEGQETLNGAAQTRIVDQLASPAVAPRYGGAEGDVGDSYLLAQPLRRAEAALQGVPVLGPESGDQEALLGSLGVQGANRVRIGDDRHPVHS